MKINSKMRLILMFEILIISIILLIIAIYS